MIVITGLVGWKLQGIIYQSRFEGKLDFESVLLDEPTVYERWQYFFIDGYSVKVASDQILEYADRLHIVGEDKGGRIDNPQIQKVGKSDFHWRLFLARSFLKEKIFQAIPQPQASFLAGILLGTREDLPKSFKENLIKTGTIHVVVVSGYNIAVVGGFLASLSKFLNRRLASVLAITGIVFYTLLVGADPPAARAAIMGSLAFFAVLTGRQRFSFFSLLLAGFVMLIAQPSVLANISFQLSFMATAGIIFFHRLIYSYVKRLPEPINEDLATTISAQVLVIPIIFYHFGSISLLSPIVNSLVLWVIPLATILGFAFLAISFLVWPIAQIISWVIWALLSIFIFTVDFFAQAEFAYLKFETKNFFILIGYYLVLTGVILQNRYAKLAKRKQV